MLHILSMRTILINDKIAAELVLSRLSQENNHARAPPHTSCLRPDASLWWLAAFLPLLVVARSREWRAEGVLASHAIGLGGAGAGACRRDGTNEFGRRARGTD